MYPIKSILEKSAQSFNNAKTLKEAKEIFTNVVGTSGIKETDKRKLITTIEGIKGMVKLQQYYYNSLLKFEGYSLRQASSIEEDN